MAPLWIEDKYDGIRCQLHKAGQRVALYSRDLKEITSTFHDVADSARQLPADLILDGEIVAMRGETILPFSDLQKRLGRRERDLFLHEEIPIQFVAAGVPLNTSNSWRCPPWISQIRPADTPPSATGVSPSSVFHRPRPLCRSTAIN